MKKLAQAFALTLAFVAPFSLAADASAKIPEAHPYTAKSPKLSRAQLDQLLTHPEQIVVIDLRRPDELTAIGGLGVYLSIQSKELEKSLAFIPKDRTVITVSNHAGRAGVGADLLASKGFKVAGAVGVQDYEAEGGTLVKIAKPELKADVKPETKKS